MFFLLKGISDVYSLPSTPVSRLRLTLRLPQLVCAMQPFKSGQNAKQTHFLPVSKTIFLKKKKEQ